MMLTVPASVAADVPCPSVSVQPYGLCSGTPHHGRRAHPREDEGARVRREPGGAGGGEEIPGAACFAVSLLTRREGSALMTCWAARWPDYIYPSVDACPCPCGQVDVVLLVDESTGDNATEHNASSASAREQLAPTPAAPGGAPATGDDPGLITVGVPTCVVPAAGAGPSELR